MLTTLDFAIGAIALATLAIVAILVKMRLDASLARIEEALLRLDESVFDELDRYFDDLDRYVDELLALADKDGELNAADDDETLDDIELDVEFQAVLADLKKLVEDEDLISDEEEQETENDGNQIKKDDRNVRDT